MHVPVITHIYAMQSACKYVCKSLSYVHLCHAVSLRLRMPAHVHVHLCHACACDYDHLCIQPCDYLHVHFQTMHLAYEHACMCLCSRTYGRTCHDGYLTKKLGTFSLINVHIGDYSTTFEVF